MLFTWCEKSLPLSHCKIGWNSFLKSVLWDWKTRKFNLVYKFKHLSWRLSFRSAFGGWRSTWQERQRSKAIILIKAIVSLLSFFFFLCRYWDFILQQFPPFLYFFLHLPFYLFIFTISKTINWLYFSCFWREQKNLNRNVCIHF